MSVKKTDLDIDNGKAKIAKGDRFAFLASVPTSILLFVGVCLSSSVYLLVTTVDAASTSITLSNVANSNKASTELLFTFRFLSAVIIWYVTIFMAVIDENGIVIKDGKKSATLLGLNRLSTFTCWCWMLLGVYFSCAAYLSFNAQKGSSSVQNNGENIVMSPFLIVATNILFEMAGSLGVLVTVLVTFVLWPVARFIRKCPTQWMM
jgi:hypothetical protein